jgi:hypothetical protein
MHFEWTNCTFDCSETEVLPAVNNFEIRQNTKNLKETEIARGIRVFKRSCSLHEMADVPGKNVKTRNSKL